MNRYAKCASLFFAEKYVKSAFTATPPCKIQGGVVLFFYTNTYKAAMRNDK